MSTKNDSALSPAAIRSMALDRGKESQVKVNQRTLIDKMLARYSSDFVLFRELIQNADDAQATLFHLKIQCDESNLKHQRNGNNGRVRQKTEKSSNKEYILKLPCEKQRTISRTDSCYSNSVLPKDENISEVNFHNSKIIEIHALNNGKCFTNADWKRVAAIADGNINADSVGQFGVGFFSVFAYSDEPIITSGKECMAFVWKDDRTLTTFRQELPVDQQSETTSIILQMKNPYIIQTNAYSDSQDTTESLQKKKDNENKTSMGLDNIIPNIDFQRLKAFFTKVLSFTTHINKLVISINGISLFQVEKTRAVLPVFKKLIQFKETSKNQILQLNSFIHSEQTIDIANGPSITLGHVSVAAKVVITEDLHERIKATIKKRLPSNITIQILYAPEKLVRDLEKSYTNSQTNASNKILHSLVPLNVKKGVVIPDGYIFIGFATRQTTGIGMHVHSSFIPTIERENLDLQDPYISVWNKELLTATGQIARFMYDQIIPYTIEKMTKYTYLASILASYSFQTTSPNPDIGAAIMQGFFSSTNDLLIPIQQSPSESRLTLVPSKDAFLEYSSHIHTFLKLPLVPWELSKLGLFFILKQLGLINEVDKTVILDSISHSTLLSNELVDLLTWLKNKESNDKNFVRQLLSKIRFRENINSPVISFPEIKRYDPFKISPLLTLPPNVLPNSIAKHFSTEVLESNLFLTPCTVKDLIEFYLSENQQKLLRDPQTSECILRFISKHSSQIVESYWVQIKTKLSNIKCIATNQGMKLPSESYLPSTLIGDNLPLVTFELSNTNADVNSGGIIEDDHISVSFLKRIGCRIFDMESLVKVQLGTTSMTSKTFSNDTMQALIFQLIEERPNMHETDFKALKDSKFLIGTTIVSKKTVRAYYAPHELHFPFVATELNWSSLPILDWPDIKSRSPEYAFLKEIGVREVPDISKLLDRIVQKHNNQDNKKRNNYKIPSELRYFAQRFQENYSNKLSISQLDRPFLPSIWPEKMAKPDSQKINSDVVLLSPSKTFTDVSPLCPSLLPDVVALLREHVHLQLLGIKEKPTLTEAFDILMEKKAELLETVHLATIVFEYFNELDGRNEKIIERLLKTAFIPRTDHGLLVKPTEIFIRTGNPNAKPVSTSPNSAELKNPGKEEMDTSGLIDFVDFSPKANKFLLGIGVLSYPTASALVEILIKRQADYFNAPNENKQALDEKVKAYSHCLRRLAIMNNQTNELLYAPLLKRLQREPWCLGLQTISKNDGKEQTTFRITTPNEIYLVDDQQSAMDLKPLCSPDDPLLTELYRKLGSRWLSDCAQRVLLHTGNTYSSSRANSLEKLILERLDMLFVDNRSKPIDEINKEKADLISSTLSVRETDGIECQLSFEGKTTKVKSASYSCALELERKQATLYLLKKQMEIDYFEIARALAQFVFKSPNETTFCCIKDKLASSLEELRRRGIPVERLLKHVDLPQPVAGIQRQPIKKDSFTSEKDNQFGRKQSQQNLTEEFTDSDQDNANGSHVVNSNTVIDRVKDFGEHSTTENNSVKQIIQGARSFTGNAIHRSENERIENIHCCTLDPAMHLERTKHTFHSIPVYVDRDVKITEKMMNQAEQLAWLIKNLATQVFKIPINTVHLFRDIDGAAIAFNREGAIFYNLRYYEQVFANKLNQSAPSNKIVQQLVNFYFLITCHELTHNVCPAHDIKFLKLMEKLTVEYLPSRDIFIREFSFNSNESKTTHGPKN